ncbi:MAG: 2-dehydropantoate 2-reductase [Spirochaetaceae bacterium]|nr:MAG: 2-dehydropantoate 2-reductase [Spirochaetaceae bacterium]
MQVTVFGAGGVGGYMAAKLGSLSGHDSTLVTEVSVVARGDHLEAIRSTGLCYVAPNGSETIVKLSAASDDPADLPQPDMVLFCVKGYDLEAAGGALASQLERGTPVLPLLNGADIDERLRSLLPGCVVFPGCIYISAFIEEPGRVRHAGGPGSIVFGTSPDDPSYYPEQFLGACRLAGIPLEWQKDPAPAIWSKFLFIAPFSLITAVSGQTLGGVLTDQRLRTDAEQIVAETAAVALRKGVALPDDIVESTMQKAAGFPPDTRTSFQRDIAARRPRDERDIFAGTILRLGENLGVKTPVTQRYARQLPDIESRPSEDNDSGTTQNG